MDKLCVILRQPTHPTIRLQRGALATIMADVPCSVHVPTLEDNPFSTPSGPTLQGGAQKRADRIITLPIQFVDEDGDTQVVDVQEKDTIAIGELLYAVDQLATDASFPTSIMVNAELQQEDEEDDE